MRGRLPKLRIFTCAVAALLTLEFCARLDDWVRFRAPFRGRYDMGILFPDDTLTGVPNGHFQNYQLNSLGYRGPQPRSGTIRIACIGASETFGVFEAPGKQFPRQLEDLLNRDLGVSSIEVFNIARPGHHLDATVHELPQILNRVHPQFLVMYPSTANFGTTEYYARLFGPPPTTPRGVSAPARDLLRDSPPRLREILSKTAALARTALRVAKRIAEWPFVAVDRGYGLLRLSTKIDQLGYVMPAGWTAAFKQKLGLAKYRLTGGIYFDRFSPEIDERYRRDLQKIADVASARGVRLVLVLHASNVPAVRADGEIMHWNSYYPYTSEAALVDLENRLNRVMAEIAAERGLALVDAAHGIPKGMRDFADFAHFTTEGAARMAQLIAQPLEPQLREMLQARRADIGR